MKLTNYYTDNCSKIILDDCIMYTDATIIKNDAYYILFTGHLFGDEQIKQDVLKHVFSNKTRIDDIVEATHSFNGEWAIICINKETHAKYVFTDPLGTIPIYYNTIGEISTDIYDLLDNEYQFDKIYMSEVAKWGYNTDDRTPFASIKRVMPQKLGILIDNKYYETRIYKDFFNKWILYNYKIRDILHNAILRQLNDCKIDKNIAVLLSGGLDSSIISYELLTINKEVYDNKLKLKFYTLDEDEEDVRCALEFCKMYGIETNLIKYDKSNVDLKNALIVNKSPVDLGSMVLNQIIFSNIKEKTYFTGDGADCLFGGFRRIDKYDSQLSDLFEEHPFYYSPKGYNANSAFDVTLNCPFNDFDVVKYALDLPLEERTHKKCMKDAYRDVLPKCIIERQKLPLKSAQIVEDREQYRYRLIKLFNEINFKEIL